MAQTKEQRRAAGKKAAKTREKKRREQVESNPENSPHEVDRPDDVRTSEQDALAAYGVTADAHDSDWHRPSELEAPPPRDGFTQRWIRIRWGNEEDVSNSSRKFREGWLPRTADSVEPGYLPPTIRHARLGNLIGVGDLILCEMPIRKAMQRNAFWQSKTDRMVEGIESDLRNVSQHGPRIKRSAKTSVTKRRLRVPEDPTE